MQVETNVLELSITPEEDKCSNQPKLISGSNQADNQPNLHNREKMKNKPIDLQINCAEEPNQIRDQIEEEQAQIERPLFETKDMPQEQ